MVFATLFDLSRVWSVVSVGSEGVEGIHTYGGENSPVLIGKVAQVLGVEFHYGSSTIFLCAQISKKIHLV